MTEVDEATAPFVEAEIKEHHAALIRQIEAPLPRATTNGAGLLLRISGRS
jgi:hypothetical protein